MSKRKKLTPKQIVDAIILYKMDVTQFGGKWGADTEYGSAFDQTTLERAVYKCANETEAFLAERSKHIEHTERVEYERLKAKYG